MGSLHPFIGPEPACGISETVAGQAIRDWTHREHHKYWQSILGQKHAKGFLEGPLLRQLLLKLSRFQIRQVTGHCYLRGHLFKLGKVNNPIFRRCYHEIETALHILCDCEASVDLRFRHLSRYFLKPGNYHEIPALLQAWSYWRIRRLGMHEISANGLSAQVALVPTPFTYIPDKLRGQGKWSSDWAR
jgi:hypothetical protein